MNSFMKIFARPIITALAILIFLAPSAMSQEFGIKGGLSYSDQSYKYDLSSFNSDRLKQTGITAGAFFSYDIWLLSGLRFEFNYVQKGSSIEILQTEEFGPAILGKIKIVDRLDYLSLNILLTPGLYDNSTLAPYLVLGPRADILLNTSSEIPSLVFDNLSPIIFGATAGLGISLALSNSTSLLIEGVYNYDFSFAYDKEILTIKNNAVLVTTGLTF